VEIPNTLLNRPGFQGCCSGYDGIWRNGTFSHTTPTNQSTDQVSETIGQDAPKVPPEDISLYSYKRAADDIAELANQLNVKKIILGGHDWGGMIVWRAALWHPKLVSHVFSVCTPYAAPQKTYASTEDLVKGGLPQFGYQLHLASPEVEQSITTPEQIRQFISGIFGGHGPNGEVVFDPRTGVLLDNLPKVGKARLVSDEVRCLYVELIHVLVAWGNRSFLIWMYRYFSENLHMHPFA
jgi:pimeloyl-ACP methyl ester carboxylesterase